MSDDVIILRPGIMIRSLQSKSVFLIISVKNHTGLEPWVVQYLMDGSSKIKKSFERFKHVSAKHFEEIK